MACIAMAQEWRTATVKSDLNPRWENEVHDFFVYSTMQKITIEIFDEARLI